MVATEKRGGAVEDGGGGRKIRERVKEGALGKARVVIVHGWVMSTATNSRDFSDRKSHV